MTQAGSDASASKPKTLRQRLHKVLMLQWRTVEEEQKQNVELLDLSNQILKLTQEVRTMATTFRDRDDIAALAKEVRAVRSSRVELSPDPPVA